MLVQWLELALEDTTWEDWDSLRDTYNLRDNVVFPEKGVDSNRAQRESVEAKLHDESRLIQRCFDDNKDDNKR